ncbi:MAG: hypothetical protein ACOCYE_12985, partial [Pseudomonadota bacterium]
MRPVLCLAILVLTTPPAFASTPFDSVARQIGPLCATAPATSCFDAAFTAVDADGDGHLDLGEVQRAEAAFRTWTSANWEALPTADRTGIALGLLVLDGVGLEALFRSYDADGDGRLTPAELQADIDLDERPLPELVAEGDAVDWAGVARR